MKHSTRRLLSGAFLLTMLAALTAWTPAAAAAPGASALLAPNPAPAQGAAQPAAKAEKGALPALIQQPTNQCIEITVWAKNPDTGECQEFSNPCSVPQGWTIYFDPTTCANA